jgi:protein SCO1/2
MLCFYACKQGAGADGMTPATVLPFYNSPEFDAEWIASTDSLYEKIHTIDTFTLTSQQGHRITKDSLDGHIYVANFFFTTCPGICPKMVNNLQVLQQTFANNPTIKLVSFSVMPWVDSVNRLKAYGEAHNINPTRWYLLTGSQQRIYTLGRKSYFAEKGLGRQKTSDEFLHTESMLLVDKKGRIRGIYNATQKLDIERVTDDILVLLK